MSSISCCLSTFLFFYRPVNLESAINSSRHSLRLPGVRCNPLPVALLKHLESAISSSTFPLFECLESAILSFPFLLFKFLESAILSFPLPFSRVGVHHTRSAWGELVHYSDVGARLHQFPNHLKNALRFKLLIGGRYVTCTNISRSFDGFIR